ncbi:MAG: plasmid mobilization relaxosome protein MobC [Alphaproteobacteria bacterium]
MKAVFHNSTVKQGKYAALKAIAKPQIPSPFCLRLSQEERTRLEQDAGDMPLGAYVRSRLFDTPILTPRRPEKRPVRDRVTLGRLLAELGKARLANNLNQLAKAVNSGSLPVTDETVQAIHEAYTGVTWMRQTLIAALGLHPEDQP